MINNKSLLATALYFYVQQVRYKKLDIANKQEMTSGPQITRKRCRGIAAGRMWVLRVLFNKMAEPRLCDGVSNWIHTSIRNKCHTHNIGCHFVGLPIDLYRSIASESVKIRYTFHTVVNLLRCWKLPNPTLFYQGEVVFRKSTLESWKILRLYILAVFN